MKTSTFYNYQLIVSVYQNGEQQLQRKFGTTRWLKHDIYAGSSTSFDLFLPFSSLVEGKKLFSIDRKGVSLWLEPGYAGFVNTGTLFGDVTEFLTPQGTRIPLAALGLPSITGLRPGARGQIKVGDFDIIFKIEKPILEKPSYMASVGLGFFSFQATQSQLEKYMSWIAAACATLTLVPLTWFLVQKSPKVEFSLRSLSDTQLYSFISTKHFSVLPWYLSNTAEPAETLEDPVSHIIKMVRYFTYRWHPDLFEATIMDELIVGGPKYESSQKSFPQLWLKSFVDTQKRERELFLASLDPHHQKAFRPEPQFLTYVSGNSQGSLNQRLRLSMQNFEKLILALKSMEQSEFEFVKTYFAEREIDLEKIHGDPSIRSKEKSAIGPSFEKLRNLVEMVAVYESRALKLQADRESEKLKTASTITIRSKKGELGIAPDTEVSMVELNISSAVWPNFLASNASFSADGLTNLQQNVDYALRPETIPKLVLKRPYLSQTELRKFLHLKKEEIRACYESRLVQKPGLVGRLELIWTITLAGKAKKIGTLRTTIDDKPLENCLKERFEDWQFPKPVIGDVTVSFPFKFVISQ